MFKKEHERASTASRTLDLKPPYSDKVATKQYPLNTRSLIFRSSMDARAILKSRWPGSFDFMGPHSSDVELCLRDFSKSLTNRAYTWYLNLKPRSIQD